MFTTIEFSYNYKDNIVKTWCVIRTNIKQNTQHNDLPTRFVHNDMIVDTLNDITNCFNEYFNTIDSQFAEFLLQMIFISIIIYIIHITMLL